VQLLNGAPSPIQKGIDLRWVVAAHLRRELGVIQFVHETSCPIYAHATRIAAGIHH
jgi:hypothetical protein